MNGQSPGYLDFVHLTTAGEPRHKRLPRLEDFSVCRSKPATYGKVSSARTTITNLHPELP